jgi:predicted amidohydrolase
MNTFRIALANIRFPATPEESVTLAEDAIAEASVERAGLICFPECFTPGYRGIGKVVPPPDPAFLERAWSAIAAAAAKATLAVVLGTERVVDGTCWPTTDLGGLALSFGRLGVRPKDGISRLPSRRGG